MSVDPWPSVGVATTAQAVTALCGAVLTNTRSSLTASAGRYRSAPPAASRPSTRPPAEGGLIPARTSATSTDRETIHTARALHDHVLARHPDRVKPGARCTSVRALKSERARTEEVWR